MSIDLLRFPSHWNKDFAALVRRHCTFQEALELMRLEQGMFVRSGEDTRATASAFRQAMRSKYIHWGPIEDTWNRVPSGDVHMTYFVYDPYDHIRLPIEAYQPPT